MKFNYEAAKLAGYNDEEINSFIKSIPKKEGIVTFAKAALNATGIPKFAKIAGAAAETVGSMALMKSNPELASKLADNALKLRTETGTTGSVSTKWGGEGQGSVLKTIGNTAESAVRTGLTASGMTNPIAVGKVALASAPIGGVISKVTGGTFSEGAGEGVGSSAQTAQILKLLGKIKAVKTATSITGKTLSPIKEFKAPSLSKGLASQATEAAKGEMTKFDKAKYWEDFGKNISELTPEEQVKAIPKFLKQLSVETGRPLETLEKQGFDKVIKRISFNDFKGGNVVSMIEGLTQRRKAAKAAYDAITPMNKIISMLTGIKKANPMAAARNQAFNEQLHKIGGIKTWDKIVEVYKSPIPTLARNAVIAKLASPLLSKLVNKGSSYEMQ